MEIKLDTDCAARNSEPHPVSRPRPAGDTVSLSNSASLRHFIEGDADVRAAEVARASRLFASADYPSAAVVHRISLLLAKDWPQTRSQD